MQMDGCVMLLCPHQDRQALACARDADLEASAGQICATAAVGDVDLILCDAEPLHQRIGPLLCRYISRLCHCCWEADSCLMQIISRGVMIGGCLQWPA